ncbi:hypothetical protein F4009_03440 [Candidatus Poribacteria bacterium]|nr:hypothetical protein [Candidatus Poribacteria bacterium]MYK93052.1 hypothetical protein [Candidatus Poribacteria bacterium]
MTIPVEPKRNPPRRNEAIYKVYEGVREALFALPTYFRSDTSIEGILATDIFTLNAAFGATIEDQVVSTLNRMREVWDPNEKFMYHRFVRQPQTFPDVLLKRDISKTDEHESEILLGIELKSWYLLAKEAEPSFRFQVTPAACAKQDLIVVIPWALNNVISGYPKIFPPYVELAKYAAEYRNYWWKHIRKTKSSIEIMSPQNVSPYPQKSDKISDKPVFDGGNNFGRFARTGIMDSYLEIAKRESLCGIGAEHWLSFFKIFQEERDEESIKAELRKLRTLVTGTDREDESDLMDALEKILSGVDTLLDQNRTT